MPYEVSFTMAVPIADREQYINECCVGGDVVVGRLLPGVTARYADVESNQEDWGWFIWFRMGDVKLAIDVFTDDPDAGLFRAHLTSRVKKRLFGERVADTPELDDVRDFVVGELAAAGATDDGPVGQWTLIGGRAVVSCDIQELP